MFKAVLILGAVAFSHAKITTHFLQSSEIGLEQLEQYDNTDKITFFAAVQNERDSDEYEYLLSFGPPSCETSCSQSRNDLCNPNVDETVTEGWQHFELGHYPKEDDPAAFYIRYTVSAGNILPCPNDYIKQTIDLTTLDVTLEGELYLSMVERCDSQSCPTYHVSDIYPFTLFYNKSANSISGIDYRFSKYSFSSEATRNIRVTNVGLVVEIETQVLFSNYEYSTDYVETQMARITDISIADQDCTPPMKIHTFTHCDEANQEKGCTQRLYLTPIERTDADAYSLVKGSVKLKCTITADDGSESSVASLLLDVEIDSPSDYGTEERPVDVVLSKQKTPLFGTSDFYNPHNSENDNLVNKQYACVSLADPSLTPLAISSIVLCGSHETTDMEDCSEPDLLKKTLYSSSYLVNSGHMHKFQGQGNEATFCFEATKLTNGTHILELKYYSYIGQESIGNSGASEDDMHEVLDASLELIRITVQRRRSMFNNSDVGEQVVHSEVFFFDCPGDSFWDPDCDCCILGSGISSSTTSLIVLSVLMVLIFAMFVACLCWYDDPEHFHREYRTEAQKIQKKKN